MSRWSHLDSDEERLPSGMSRIGYDADTQTYTFRNHEDGSVWEGSPGCEYGGHMTRISGPRVATNDEESGEAGGPPPYSAAASECYEGPTAPSSHQYFKPPSWRQEMGPFLNFVVILGLFLIGVFWYVNSAAAARQQAANDSTGPTRPQWCEGSGSTPRVIMNGDTCWGIAQTVGVELADLMRLNPGLDCDRLGVGNTMCVPVQSEE